MNQEIEEIIKKNLPAQVGEVLKKQLDQAEKDAATVIHQKERIEQQQTEINALSVKLQKHYDLDQREAEIKTRELNVSDKERAIEVFALQIRLEEANKRAELISGFTAALVRNTEFRKTIFDSETQSPFQDVNGTWHYPSPTSKSHTENKTAE